MTYVAYQGCQSGSLAALIFINFMLLGAVCAMVYLYVNRGEKNLKLRWEKDD